LRSAVLSRLAPPNSFRNDQFFLASLSVAGLRSVAFLCCVGELPVGNIIEICEIGICNNAMAAVTKA